MTVPGKGGRPRKWRTDADRIRAFRARQQGLPEPPVLTQALQDGDELARALDLARRLGVELDESRQTVRELRKDLAAANRALKSDHRRFAWIEASNAELVSERDRALADRDELADELADLRDQLRDLPVQQKVALRDSPSLVVDRQLPRAERRRLEREHRRRGDN
jgi:molybdopterin converting factor small subunit